MHLFLRHTIRNETHITRIDINLCRFAQHINLVESIHDIFTNSTSTMFFPHNHIIIIEFFNGGFRQCYRTGQCIRNNPKPRGQKAFVSGIILQSRLVNTSFSKRFVMRHSDQFNGMCVQRCFIGRALTNKIIVHTQMRR